MSEGQKSKWRVGLILIGASYPLWAMAMALGALQLKGGSFPWWLVGAALLVLNYVAFVLGILLAGKEGVGFLRDSLLRFARRLRRRTFVKRPMSNGPK